MDFNDVLIKPRYSTVSSRRDVDIYKDMKSYNVLPIIVANMDSIATFKIARLVNGQKVMTAIKKNYPAEELVEWFNGPDSQRSFYTMGMVKEDWEKFLWVRNKCNLPLICIDVANGHTQRFLETIKDVRTRCVSSLIMAGNIGTPDMVMHIRDAGADIIKVGLGSGTACTTREITGVGYPQLSLVRNSSNQGVPICSDGGVRCPGDVCKALAAGAQYVMLGGMLAGHDECEGEFYGNASEFAMKIHEQNREYRTAEGRVVDIPYRGTVSDAITQIEGGLRSMMSYIGARTLDEIPEKAEFIKI